MIDRARRDRVRRRVGARCEYCRLPESAVDLPFHIQHIRTRQHGGTNSEENLAPACDRCNLHKRPNLSSIDPATDQIVLLFHPRLDFWEEHFGWSGPSLVGITPVGWATVRLLNINAPQRVRLRTVLIAAGAMHTA